MFNDSKEEGDYDDGEENPEPNSGVKINLRHGAKTSARLTNNARSEKNV